MSLDYTALRALARSEAEEHAKLFFPPHMVEERKAAQRILEARYYAQYVTPPSRY